MELKYIALKAPEIWRCVSKNFIEEADKVDFFWCFFSETKIQMLIQFYVQHEVADYRWFVYK